MGIGTGARMLLHDPAQGVGARLGSGPFLLKLSLVLVAVIIEPWPASMLLRWRMRRREPLPRDAGRIEVLSYVQCALIVWAVLAAVHAGAIVSAAAPGAVDTPGVIRDSAAGMRAAARPSTAVEVPPIAPTGSEVVTPEDVALLEREIAMPLDGVDPAGLRSSFTERRGGGTRQHNALDIMAARGTAVRSVAKGRVLKLFTSAAGGLMVYAADSSERFIFHYAHLDGYAPGLRDGARLEQGQVIGYVGSSGNASPSAPHLHFAIARSADVRRWSRGQPIDPLPVLTRATAARRRPGD